MRRNVQSVERFEACVGKIKSNPSNSNLSELRRELNKLIPESTCLDVIYTQNTDKLFFGAKTLIVLSDSQASDILLTDEIVKIDKYYLEIDSKLFDMGLNTKEITAILLHEVGHIVIGGNTVSDLRKAIDNYFAKSKTSLSFKDTSNYLQILKFGMQDAIMKMHSIFYMTEPEEIAADSFVSLCGYDIYLLSAFKKIYTTQMTINSGTPKLMVLQWSFDVYKELKWRRIPAIRLLNKSKQLTGSYLEKQEIENVIRALNRIDTDITNESVMMIMNESKNKNSLFTNMKRNGLKTLENDLYEFRIRCKNCESEDEAFYALRQINTRISILEDYLLTEELSDQEREKWYKVLTEYRAMREELASKKIYNKKQYGIWFDYNQLD